MNIISIDWKLAEEKPESRQKIEGKVLMDLRARIDNLEIQLERYKVELGKKVEEIVQIQKKLSNTEDHLSSVSELFTLNKSELGKNEELFKQEREVQKNINVQLEKSLIKVQKEKKELEMQLEKISPTIEKNKEFELVFSQKDKEIEHLASIMAEKEDQLKILERKLDQKEKEISRVKEGLEVTIEDKNKMINKLRDKITQKTADLLVLSQKVEQIEKHDKDAKVSTRLIEKVLDLLQTKGFVSDKEFELMQNELRNEQMIYH